MFCTYIVTLYYINGSAECMIRKYITYYLTNLLEFIVHIFLEVDVDIVIVIFHLALKYLLTYYLEGLNRKVLCNVKERKCVCKVYGGEVIVEKSKYFEEDKSCTISSTSK